MLKKFWKNFEFFFLYEKLVKIFCVEENFFNTWTFFFQTLVMCKGNQDVYKNGPPKTQKWPSCALESYIFLHIYGKITYFPTYFDLENYIKYYIF